MALLAPLRVTLRGLNEGVEINLERFIRFHSERRSGGAEVDRSFYEPESVLFASQTEHKTLILCYNFALSLFAQPTIPHFDRRCCRRSCTGQRSSLPMQGNWCWILDATLPNTSRCSLRCKTDCGEQLRHEGGIAVTLDRNTRFRASGSLDSSRKQENDVMPSGQGRISWVEEG